MDGFREGVVRDITAWEWAKAGDCDFGAFNGVFHGAGGIQRVLG